MHFTGTMPAIIAIGLVIMMAVVGTHDGIEVQAARREIIDQSDPCSRSSMMHNTRDKPTLQEFSFPEPLMFEKA